MFRGDSLTVLALLLSIAAGAVITGYSVEGAKRRNLYILAAVFALLSGTWLILPSGVLGTPAQVLLRLLAVMPVVIVGLVAVMIRSMRDKVEEALAHQPEAPVGAPAERERQARFDNLGRRVMAVRYDAKRAAAGKLPNPDAIKSSVESVFATLRHQFDVETPIATGAAPRDILRVYIAYLDAVWPFLQDGNYGEAQERASEFMGDKNLRSDKDQR
jgi:hypothetical protein